MTLIKSGNLIATAGKDHNINIWKLTYDLHNQCIGINLDVQLVDKCEIYCLNSLSKNDKILLSGGSDKVIKVWNIETGDYI